MDIRTTVDVVVDLETGATGVDATILAIGAVAVVDRTIVGEFYATGLGAWQNRAWDRETVLWWMRQDERARAELDRPNRRLEDALAEFGQWIKARRRFSQAIRPVSQQVDALGFPVHPVAPLRIWGNGASFDVAILEHAIGTTWRTQSNIFRAWTHRDIRDLRTIKEVCGIASGAYLDGEFAHHAQHDARREARELIACFDVIAARGAEPEA